MILVRLKTPEALDYEGTAAHNCVGGGSYDKLLNKTLSGIYSLRRLTKDGELKPVVTIEYNDGVVKQIHGPCNGIVGFDYTMAARDAVLRLMNLDSIQDLVADERFAENRLNCLGLYRDGEGSYFDIMTISEDVDFEIPKLIVEASSIKDYDFEKLRIKDVVIEGKLTSADAKYISKFRHATKIAIKALGEDCHIDLQGFDELEKLEIDAKSHLCTIITGKGEYETMVYSGDRLPLIGGDGKISHLKLHLREAQKIALSDLPKVKELSLFAKPETFIKADSCQPMIDTLHMEEVSIDSMTTKEFPKLQHLEITGNFEGDLRLPLLKTLQWNYFSNENHEFDLSFFPQIEEVTFVGGKHWTDNTTKLKCRGIYPNLKKLRINNVIVEDIDFGCFPKLEDVSITANNDYEINLSAQQEIQYMSIRGTSIFHTCTLKGKEGKIKKLDIEGNIRIKSEIEDTPQIKQVAFHDMELNDGLFCDLGAEQTTFDGCLITTEIAKKYITGSKIHLVANFGNKIKEEVADFSDSKIINAHGILNLDVKKLILPEKVDHFDFSYKVSPETEIIGRCSPNTLIVHEDNRLLDYINYEDVKETSCYTDKLKELIPLMTSLKYLQSYPIPAEMLLDSVETWHIHDSISNLVFTDINAVTIQEPDKRENEVSFWNAKNVKNFSFHSFVSRNTNVDFPQNMEECKIEGYSELEEMDFSKYKKLKKLTISVVDEKLRKIKLPVGIEELKADKSMNGIGIIYGGSGEPMPVEWEIPETANPQVIKYLQNQYGNDNVRLLKEQKTQAMLPMLVWQQKFLGGTIKS